MVSYCLLIYDEVSNGTNSEITGDNLASNLSSGMTVLPNRRKNDSWDHQANNQLQNKGEIKIAQWVRHLPCMELILIQLPASHIVSLAPPRMIPEQSPLYTQPSPIKVNKN